MGTISDKLMRIINTKEDIRQALISKGYDVPTSIPFKEYAKMISDLPCRVDSFPDIEGIVARYSALGLTNEQMATNPVWVDKTGNGHDLQMKNFAWKGMSGVGGYEMNFNLWGNNVPNVPDISMSTTTTSVSVSVGNSTYNNNLIYIHINNWDINKNHWLKVTSTYEDGDLAFLFYKDSNTKKIGLPANGYVNILAYPEFKGSYMYISTTFNKQGSFTIEQLPLYPGALVFDGVDDYGTCDNFPILTKEKGYTVVALRQYLVEKSTAYLTANGDSVSNTSFIFEGNNYKDTWNLGRATTIQASRILATQTSKQYNDVKLNIGTNTEGSNLLQVGKWSKSYSNVAIWELVYLDHDATEEELTKIKDYFVKTYPWLFPDQAWTVVGKTNEDGDRATIANITGNGNNLVLSNFGFAENSGYGLYYQYFGNGFKTTNGEIIGGSWDKINNYNIHCNIRMPINAIGKCFWDSSVLTTGIKLRFKLTGMAEGDVLAFGYTNVYDLTYTSDGIYIIELPPTDKSCGFSLQSSLTENLPTTPVTIELLPFDYEGYLVTDGVDDEIQSSNFSIGKDFMVVGEWKMLKNSDTYELAGINKYDSFILYNYSYNNRINVYIHGGQGTPINTDSIKSFTSTGLIYIDNFNNVEEVIPRDKTDRGYALFIGYNNNVFTKLAFKNLAIYSEVLSKEDCIKAYNYLQTLKSK